MMAEYLKNTRCDGCYHVTACDRWVMHGFVLYDDYYDSYSVDGCPDYVSTADVVEVRHGEWLPYPSDAYMKCSICGMEYHKSRMPDVVGYCPNPNCGAKMDGGGRRWLKTEKQ